MPGAIATGLSTPSQPRHAVRSVPAREQIAGDLINAKAPPEKYAEGVIATGFLAIARRFGHDIDKDMYLTHEDVIDTMSKVVLGLSVGCARCHNHKFDPITAEDYYALYGIFQSTRFSFPGCEPAQQPRDLVPLIPPSPKPPTPPKAQAKDPKDPAVKPPVVEVAYAVRDGSKPSNAKVQLGGDPKKLAAEVPRRWLEVFGGEEVPANAGSGRLQLAGWLTAKDNPLTPRVIVNRIWLQHFGRGIVKTPNDFGSRGSPPTHPELLDWLTSDFVESGWSIKAVHRRIMLSAAYQQAGSDRSDGTQHDPNNDLYWRFARRRLSAEEIRDSLLTVSGQLDLKPGGPHPFPPEKSWGFSQHGPFRAVYDNNQRSVYQMVMRNSRHPFLGLFDGADPNATTPQRQDSTVPTQALYFMNDPFFHKQAEKLAERLLALDEGKRLGELFRLTLQREPTKRETEILESLFERYGAELKTPATERPRVLWAAAARVVLAGNEFLYLD